MSIFKYIVLFIGVTLFLFTVMILMYQEAQKDMGNRKAKWLLSLAVANSMIIVPLCIFITSFI